MNTFPHQHCQLTACCHRTCTEQHPAATSRTEETAKTLLGKKKGGRKHKFVHHEIISNNSSSDQAGFEARLTEGAKGGLWGLNSSGNLQS